MKSAENMQRRSGRICDLCFRYVSDVSVPKWGARPSPSNPPLATPDSKLANNTPIFKKGDRHFQENYRPVSLTSVPCNILEHIVCRHIIKHQEEKKILTSVQHGFRSGH